MPSITQTILLLTAVLFSTIGHAGQFNLSQSRFFLNDQQRTASTNVINTGQDRVSLQVQAFRWYIDETGADAYEPTRELSFFPKIFNLEAGEQRLLRLGYRGTTGETEQTYRLYIKQLPIKKNQESVITPIVRMGLPVFVAPRAADNQPLQLQSMIAGATMPKLLTRNPSNNHRLAKVIWVTGVNDAGQALFSEKVSGWYVLPGTERAFPMQLPGASCHQVRSLQLRVEMDKTGVVAGELPFDPRLCR